MAKHDTKKPQRSVAERQLLEFFYEYLSAIGIDWHDAAEKAGENPESVNRRYHNRGEGYKLLKRKTGPSSQPPPQAAPNAEGATPSVVVPVRSPASIAVAMTSILADRGHQTRANLAVAVGNTADALAQQTEMEREQAAAEGRAARPLVLASADKVAALVKAGASLHPEQLGEEGGKGRKLATEHTALMRLEATMKTLPPGVVIIEVETVESETQSVRPDA